MIWTAIDITEPPGKPLKHCKLERITITPIDPKEGTEVQRRYGRSAKGQQQILRMTVEAQDQEALLTQEDPAEILGTDVRTVSGMGSSLRLTLVDNYRKTSCGFTLSYTTACCLRSFPCIALTMPTQ